MADTAVRPAPASRGSSRWRRLGRRFLPFLTLVRILRANPVTLVGFVLVVLILLTGLAVAIPQATTAAWADQRALVLAPLPPPSSYLPPSLSGLAGFVGPLLSALQAFGKPIASLLPQRAWSLLPYDPNAFTGAYAQPPSLAHPFGTDQISRDMFSRVLAALPLDLFIGVGISGFALGVGTALGLVAGFFDRPNSLWAALSATIMRVTDVFLAFPSLVLALAVAASLGRTTTSAILAVMVTWWPYYVRLARGEVLAVKHQPYVMAARAAGVSEVRILFRHVLRNILEPLIVYYTMDIGTVLVTFSTISFVGIAVPFTVPEWGSMIEFYEGQLTVYPWTVLAPGLAVFVTVLAFALLGDGLRDILDPRSRRAMAVAPTGLAGAPAPPPTGASEA